MLQEHFDPSSTENESNPLDRILELSDWKFRKFEPVKNKLIDFYLDGFRRRERNKEKKSIMFINYLTIVSYIVSIVKYLAGFIPMPYTAKLILFDMSLFFGGIEVYNRIFISLALVLGLYIHLTLRWTKSGTHREWTQVLQVTRSRVLHKFMRGTIQMDIIVKLVKALKVIYTILNVLSVVMSKL